MGNTQWGTETEPTHRDRERERRPGNILLINQPPPTQYIHPSILSGLGFTQTGTDNLLSTSPINYLPVLLGKIFTYVYWKTGDTASKLFPLHYHTRMMSHTHTYTHSKHYTFTYRGISFWDFWYFDCLPYHISFYIRNL